MCCCRRYMCMSRLDRIIISFSKNQNHAPLICTITSNKALCGIADFWCHWMRMLVHVHALRGYHREISVMTLSFISIVLESKIIEVQSSESIKSREKGRNLTQSYDKSPYTDRKKSKKQRDNTKKRHQNFDYTTIADRLRTVFINDIVPQWRLQVLCDVSV